MFSTIAKGRQTPVIWEGNFVSICNKPASLPMTDTVFLFPLPVFLPARCYVVIIRLTREMLWFVFNSSKVASKTHNENDEIHKRNVIDVLRS